MPEALPVYGQPLREPQDIPHTWRVAKPRPQIVVQPATQATIPLEATQEAADYYGERAQAFRSRPKLARDDSPADERLF